MPVHLSEKQIENYSQRAISPTELFEIDDHLTDCAACREKLSEAVRRDKIYSSFLKDIKNSEPHIGYEQLETFIKGELDINEHEKFKLHLRSCITCKRDVEELREFAATIDPRKTYAPPPAFREKVWGFLHMPSRLKGRQQEPRAGSVSLSLPLPNRKSLLLGSTSLASLSLAVFLIVLSLYSRGHLGGGPGNSLPNPYDIEFTLGGVTSDDIISTKIPVIQQKPYQSIANIVLSFIKTGGKGGANKGSVLRVTPNTNKVRITVKDEGGKYQSYRAVLRTQSGKRINLGVANVNRKNAITYTLRAASLLNGACDLILSGVPDGEPFVLGFRVEKK